MSRFNANAPVIMTCMKYVHAQRADDEGVGLAPSPTVAGRGGGRGGERTPIATGHALHVAVSNQIYPRDFS